MVQVFRSGSPEDPLARIIGAPAHPDPVPDVLHGRIRTAWGDWVPDPDVGTVSPSYTRETVL